MAAKDLLISAGLYRPARTLQRVLSARQRATFQEDLRLYRWLLPEGGALCFDIGANIGEKTEAMLRSGASVVAVEPQPECVAELRARCSGLGPLTLLQAAVGPDGPFATLHRRSFHGRSSIRADWEAPVAVTLDVPMVALDALVARYGRPYYIKIDVEGYESEVLATLSSSVPVVSFEWHRGEPGRALACLNRLIGLGATSVAATVGESSRLLFGGWLPVHYVRYRFAQLMAEAPYGDLYVRSHDGRGREGEWDDLGKAQPDLRGSITGSCGSLP